MIYIYMDEEGGICISPKTDIEDTRKIAEEGISLTDTNSEIPKINLEELETEEYER